MMDIIASKVLVHVIVGTLLMCTIDSRKLVTKRAPHLMRTFFHNVPSYKSDLVDT